MGTVLSGPQGPHGVVVTGCALWDVLQKGFERGNHFFKLFFSKMGERCHAGHPDAAVPAWPLLCRGEPRGSPCVHPRCPPPDPKRPCRSQPSPQCGGIGRCRWGLWGGFVWDRPGFPGTHHGVRWAFVLRGVGARECRSPNVRARLRVSYCFPFT